MNKIVGEEQFDGFEDWKCEIRFRLNSNPVGLNLWINFKFIKIHHKSSCINPISF